MSPCSLKSRGRGFFMPFPFLAAAQVGAMGLNAGLGAWNNSQNIGMQRETNALNYEMWQKEMDYNRPVNQVERLKEAGLNPALMYGTGSGANIAPNSPRMEAPRGEALRVDPGMIVAMQQARLMSEQERGLRLENDSNDPKKGAPVGSRKGDNSLTRAGRQFWDEARDSGGDFIRGLKSHGEDFLKRHRTTFGDWGRKGLFFGPKSPGYVHPLRRSNR